MITVILMLSVPTLLGASTVLVTEDTLGMELHVKVYMLSDNNYLANEKSPLMFICNLFS